MLKNEMAPGYPKFPDLSSKSPDERSPCDCPTSHTREPAPTGARGPQGVCPPPLGGTKAVAWGQFLKVLPFPTQRWAGGDRGASRPRYPDTPARVGRVGDKGTEFRSVARKPRTSHSLDRRSRSYSNVRLGSVCRARRPKAARLSISPSVRQGGASQQGARGAAAPARGLGPEQRVTRRGGWSAAAVTSCPHAAAAPGAGAERPARGPRPPTHQRREAPARGARACACALETPRAVPRACAAAPRTKRHVITPWGPSHVITPWGPSSCADVRAETITSQGALLRS